MRLYALVSDETGAVIDLYPSRGGGVRRPAECLTDEEAWRDVLFVWPFEFETSPN